MKLGLLRDSPEVGLPKMPAKPPGSATDAEVWTVPWFPISGEQTVYTTHRRWKGVDVFVDTPQPNPAADPLLGGVLAIFVYAISAKGARSLVASGRFRASLGQTAGGLFTLSPAWVVSARAQAERFEVSAWLAGVGPAVTQAINITVVASDECVDEPPDSVGRVTVFDVAQTAIFCNVLSPAPGGYPGPELMGVQAINGAAAARYLQYFEDPGVIIAGVPQLVWPMGAAAGSGVTDMLVRKRPQGTQGGGWAVSGFALLVSSTPTFLTRVNDCLVQAFVR